MTNYQRYGARKWQTEDGRILRWSDMPPTHLRNAAAFLCRSLDNELNAAWGAYCHVQGEFAEYAIESAINSLEGMREDAAQCAQELIAYADWREHTDSELVTQLGQLLERTAHARR